MSEKEKKTVVLDDYQKGIHRSGRITSGIVAIALLAVPIVVTLMTDIPMQWAGTLSGLVGILSLMLIMNIVEFLSYTPVLGSSLYLCFITGNTMNMKLPAALSSMKLAGVEPGSKEGSVISMIAVAVSSLTTVTVLIVGMVGVSFLLPIMQSPVLKPGFDNLMPALLGALATPFFLKDMNSLKTASVPSLIAMAVTLALGYAAFAQLQSLTLPIFMVIAVIWARFLYKRAEKKKAAAE